MPDEPDPPRKFYKLKAAEFEVVNAPLGSPSDPGAIDIHDLVRQANAAPPPTAPAAPQINEVHALLHLNLRRANAAGLNKVTMPAARPSRRKRDYWLLMIAGNTFIITIFSLEIFLGFQVMCLAAQMPQEFGRLVHYALSTPTLWAMPLFGMFTYSGTLTWLMWGLMEDY